VCGTFDPDAVAVALVAAPMRRRVVVDTWAPGPLGNVARLEESVAARWFKRLLAKAHVLVETEEIEREVLGAGFDRDRVHLVSWGLADSFFEEVTTKDRSRVRLELGLEGERVALYAGRFAFPQKRLDLLLTAWSEARPGMRLVLAGDGGDRSEVIRLCRGIDPPPIVMGWQEDVRPLLAAADIYLLPTEFESAAMIVKEGMASGRPGLVSAIDSYKEMDLPGVELVRNDLASWAAALIRVAEMSRDEIDRLGKLAQGWARTNYAPDETLPRIEALIMDEEPA
jgi:glycosyltransferase involved in cell wall biosynthesis